MASGISFGHFNIVGGVVREDGPYVGVVEDRTPAESLADLYLVIEPAQPGSEVFCAELLSLIDGQFGRPQYSVTGNLLQALRAAQEHLRAWNKTAGPDKQASAGASCLAVSCDEAYLAQIGPGVAYLRHDGHLRRVEAIESDAQAALGTTIACSPCFSRFELSQGDTLLLVTSRFRTMVDDETADLILSLPPGEALPEIYKIARNQSEFSALYLAVTGELRHAGNTDAETTDGTGGASARPARQMRRGPPDSGHVNLIPGHFETAAKGQYAHLMPESAHRSSVGDYPSRSKRRELERLTERHSLTLPRPALYTVAAVLALTLVGWFGLPQLLQTGRQDRFTTLINDAQKTEQAANVSRNPAEKRTLLEKVQADIVEARMLRAQAPELISLQASIQTAIRALDQVRSLPSVTTVADLATTPVSARSVSELAAGSQLYLLDNSSGKVFGFSVQGNGAASAAVFESGKLVESVSTAKAMHIAIQPASGNRAALLYILDNNRRLFSLDDGGTLRAVSLSGTSDWKSATALAFGGQNLYILDSQASQVWRYTVTDSGFTDPPTPMLTKADLHDAAQLTVTGDIYVGTVNGRLLRFRDGRQEEVKLSGIDHPLRAPQPPILDRSAGLQYIADPGNQRIVAEDENDVYRFQYGGVALQGLRTVALDPSSGVLYALSEQKLISAPLH